MRQLILSAGMQRSGSTWLYNALRMLLTQAGVRDIGCGWIGDFESFKNHDTVIVKTHAFSEKAASAAALIVYSYRDVRDAVASMKRKFKATPNLELATQLIEQDALWRKHAAFVMRYEDFLAAPEKIVEGLAARIGVKGVDAAQLVQALGGLSYEGGKAQNGVYDRENLLHQGHITDGRHGSYRETLSPELVAAIEDRHRIWLEDNGYFR